MNQLKSNFLLIDAGNSKTKFAIVTESGTLVQEKNSKELLNDLNTSTESLKRFSSYDSVLVSTVWKKEHSDRLLNELKKNFGNVYTVKELFNNWFDSDYNLELLGEDRIAALGYGLSQGFAPFIVIDAGTALTIDFMDESNRFRGGFICGGFQSELNSLCANTGKLPKFDLSLPVFPGIPTNTIPAITKGIIEIKGLGVRKIVEEYSNSFKIDKSKWKILIGGGEASFLKPFFPDALLIDNLVLSGLNSLLNRNLLHEFGKETKVV